ncbi:MAG TPA: hypothetical protein VFJ47_15600 [Terriglobales bacterium]|nr:hypothetical protein [Terriglobales bacterium]
MAHLDPSGVRLVSRNGNRFAFSDPCGSLEFRLRAKHAVLDGEVACLDANGHSQFNELLFRRGTPQFCAFDLLWLNGRDLRDLQLIERKHSLRKLIPPGCENVLYNSGKEDDLADGGNVPSLRRKSEFRTPSYAPSSHKTF